MHQRAQIRQYVVALLKARVSVGGNVFSNRTDAAQLEELPCVIVSFGGESAEIRCGDLGAIASYDRTLDMKIDVVTSDSEDALDQFAYEIERALFEDWTLERMSASFDPERPDGLTSGLSLTSTTPYTIDTEGEIPIYGLQLSWEVPYITDSTTLEKYEAFAGYKVEFTRTDGVTTDPVLIAGEGTI